MLFYFWIFLYRSIQYLHHFQVHCRGAEDRREDLSRKSPLELCSDRIPKNHFEENQFMHPDKKNLIWLKIMTVQCTWYEERLIIDPYKVSVDSYTSLP